MSKNQDGDGQITKMAITNNQDGSATSDCPSSSVFCRDAHLVLHPHLSLLQHHQRRVVGQRLEELLRVHQSQEVAGQREHPRRLRRNTKEADP